VFPGSEVLARKRDSIGQAKVVFNMVLLLRKLSYSIENCSNLCSTNGYFLPISHTRPARARQSQKWVFFGVPGRCSPGFLQTIFNLMDVIGSPTGELSNGTGLVRIRSG
jgi:hypothetical protein